jgi:glycosyltransferase involved in cell wall biosynthesis
MIAPMSLPEPPIRVALDAHVIGRRKAGNETYVLALARGLAARPDVEVVAYTHPGVDWPGGLQGSMRIRPLRTTSPLFRIPIELPMRARRADVLHVQYVAPPIIRTPVVTAVHDVSFEDVPEFLPSSTRIRLRMLVRMAVRRSAAIIVPSAFSRERILHHYDVDPSRVWVAPLAIGPRPPKPSPDDFRNLRSRWDLPEPFILFVGQPHPRKNLATLIAATALARSRGADLGLVVAGPRIRSDAQVEAAIAASGAGVWMRSIGYVEDATLAALYTSARLVAYPSLYEGFGLPVLEALEAGVPVVASLTSAIPEVAGNAALLVDPTDTSALADAILGAAYDEATRARLAAAGPLQAARFTAEALAEGTVAAYRYALGR